MIYLINMIALIFNFSQS